MLFILGNSTSKRYFFSGGLPIDKAKRIVDARLAAKRAAAFDELRAGWEGTDQNVYDDLIEIALQRKDKYYHICDYNCQHYVAEIIKEAKKIVKPKGEER